MEIHDGTLKPLKELKKSFGSEGKRFQDSENKSNYLNLTLIYKDELGNKVPSQGYSVYGTK